MDPQSQQPWQQPQQPTQAPPQPQSTPYGQPQPAPPTTDPSSQQPQQLVHDYSVDYLDQIAAPEKKPSQHGKLILLILVLLGILLAVAIVGMLLSGRPTSLTKANELNARIETLTKLSKDHHKHLRDNNLRATNTAFTLFLSNASSDLEAPLQAAGIEKKDTKAIAASESAYAAKLKADFEDARLNVVLDRTYARQMAYELGIIESMMRSIYNSSSSSELRGYLESANNNLVPIAKDFREFATAE